MSEEYLNSAIEHVKKLVSEGMPYGLAIWRVANGRGIDRHELAKSMNEHAMIKRRSAKKENASGQHRKGADYEEN